MSLTVSSLRTALGKLVSSTSLRTYNANALAEAVVFANSISTHIALQILDGQIYYLNQLRHEPAYYGNEMVYSASGRTMPMSEGNVDYANMLNGMLADLKVMRKDLWEELKASGQVGKATMDVIRYVLT